jgi:hypothetical protein
LEQLAATKLKEKVSREKPTVQVGFFCICLVHILLTEDAETIEQRFTDPSLVRFFFIYTLVIFDLNLPLAFRQQDSGSLEGKYREWSAIRCTC